MARWMFLAPRARQVYLDWADIAGQMVAARNQPCCQGAARRLLGRGDAQHFTVNRHDPEQGRRRDQSRRREAHFTLTDRHHHRPTAEAASPDIADVRVSS